MDERSQNTWLSHPSGGLHVMSTVDEVIASFTSRQHGVVSGRQLRAAGLSRRQIDARLETGALVVVHRDVYRLLGVPFTRELRWLAAVLAGGDGAVLSHQAAAVKHHFDVRRTKPVVSTPHRRHPELEGVTWHRTRRLTGLDVVTIDKIPMTSKARTLLDLAGVLSLDVLRGVVEDAVARGLVPIESLLAILDRRGGRGVEGTVALRTSLEGGLVDERLESKLELLLAKIIDQARVPPPVRQLELVCSDGRIVRLDNAWPDRRVALEADGRRWHGTTAAARDTRARSRSIVQTGWRHYVYGWSDATETPASTLTEIETIVLGPFDHHMAA